MEDLPTETHFNILLSAEDRELPKLCRLNAYYSSICEDDRFWKKKVKLKYDHFVGFRNRFSSWKEFYHALSYKALYVVTYQGGTYIANNIRTASIILLDILEDEGIEYLPSIYNTDELFRTSLNLSTLIEIYVMFEGDEIRQGDPNHLLLYMGEGYLTQEDIKEEDPDFLWYYTEEDYFYANPELPYLPSFSTFGNFIIFTSVQPNRRKYMNYATESINVGRVTNDFLSVIFSKAHQDELLGGFFEIISMDKHETHFNSFWYEEEEDVFVRYDFPPVIIRSSPKGIEFTIISEDYYEEFSRPQRDHIVINKTDFWDLVYSISYSFTWYSIEGETLLPPLEKEEKESKDEMRRFYYEY